MRVAAHQPIELEVLEGVLEARAGRDDADIDPTGPQPAQLGLCAALANPHLERGMLSSDSGECLWHERGERRRERPDSEPLAQGLSQLVLLQHRSVDLGEDRLDATEQQLTALRRADAPRPALEQFGTDRLLGEAHLARDGRLGVPKRAGRRRERTARADLVDDAHAGQGQLGHRANRRAMRFRDG